MNSLKQSNVLLHYKREREGGREGERGREREREKERGDNITQNSRSIVLFHS